MHIEVSEILNDALERRRKELPHRQTKEKTRPGEVLTFRMRAIGVSTIPNGMNSVRKREKENMVI